MCMCVGPVQSCSCKCVPICVSMCVCCQYSLSLSLYIALYMLCMCSMLIIYMYIYCDIKRLLRPTECSSRTTVYSRRLCGLNSNKLAATSCEICPPKLVMS
ncbi:hypothetical protein OAV88_00620 [bacterium]|nr:hypothetical protein [bacterium]